MTDRGRERLKECLEQLITDLKIAQDDVSQVMAKLVDKTANPQHVSFCQMTLSGYVQDFSTEIKEFLKENQTCAQTEYSTSQEDFSAASKHVPSTVTSTTADARSHSIADSRLTEIIERVSVLEKREVVTTLFRAESRKSQQEFSQQFHCAQSQQEDLQEVVRNMSKVVFGSGARDKDLMDLPALCDQLEKLKVDSEAAQHKISRTEVKTEQIEGKVQHVEDKLGNLQSDGDRAQEKIFNAENKTQQFGKRLGNMESRLSSQQQVMNSIQEGISDLREETQSAKHNAQSTRAELATVQQHQQQQKESISGLEIKTNQRINKLENKLNRECDSFNAQTKDLDKLRRVLNRCHLQAQQRKEQQEQLSKLHADRDKAQERISNTETKTEQLENRLGFTESQVAVVTKGVGKLEKLENGRKICFKASIKMSSGKLETWRQLVEIATLFYNQGNGLKNAKFLVPKSGFYHIGLNVHQEEEGKIDIAIVRNNLGTGSGLVTRTTHAGDRAVTASVLELKEGDSVAVETWGVVGDAKLETCVFFGYRIG